jgi:hypothetical protein
MVSEALENNVQMFSMVLLVLEINKNVVDENHDKLVKHRLKTEFMRYIK